MNKTLIVILGACLAGLGMVLGQSDASQAKTLPPYSKLGVGKGQAGGELTLHLDDTPKSFFYYGVIDSNTGVLASQIFDGLIEYNLETMKVEPALATSWSVTPDGKEWTVKLRQGVRWHDGTEFSADDVIFTYTQIITNAQARGGDVAEFTFGGVLTRFEKLDRYTVKFTLNKANGAFLQKLRKYIMPKHLLLAHSQEGGKSPEAINNAWTTDTDPSAVVGTGGFMLRGYTPGQKVVLHRNPRYWKRDTHGQVLPHLEKLSFLVIKGSESQAAAFQAGTLDALGISAVQYPTFKTQEVNGADFRVVRNNTFINSVPHWAFNFDDGNPELAKVFANTDFRKAMQSALNRERIIDSVYNGMATLPGHGVARNSGFYFDTRQLLGKFNLDTAANALDGMGLQDRDNDGVRELPSGKAFEFTLTYGSDSVLWSTVAPILQNDLKKIGLTVYLKPVATSALLSVARGKDWDSILVAFGNQPDPDLRKPIWQPGGTLYYWHQRTQPEKEGAAPNFAAMQGWERKIYTLLDQASLEPNPARRHVLYAEWQIVFGSYLPVIMIAQPPNLAVVRNTVGNYVFTTFGLPTYNPWPLVYKKH